MTSIFDGPDPAISTQWIKKVREIEYEKMGFNDHGSDIRGEFGFC